MKITQIRKLYYIYMQYNLRIIIPICEYQILYCISYMKNVDIIINNCFNPFTVISKPTVYKWIHIV